jgi:putative toxin-antitoxin system antitoxin component (TIGR02293 family)
MEKDVSKILEPEVSYASAQSSSVFSILEFIKKGIKYNQFLKYIQQTPFSISDWSEFLHISERTLHRYQKDKKTFDASHTEKIMEIILVYKKGIEVFGNNKNFDSWLIQNNIALANKMPKEFLTSSTGLKLLMEELHKIEHGILA